MGIIENTLHYQGTNGARKLSLIVFSGDFDRLTAVFTLVTGAATVGYEVNIFFTFWGLDAIKRKQGRSFTGKGFLSRVFGFMMGGLGTAPTSRLNFMGLGPKIFRYMMRRNNVATLEELLDAAKALGIHLYMPVRWRCTFSDWKKATSSKRWRMCWEWPLS